MATLHKCDKCGKIIKGNVVDITFGDSERKFFEKYYNHSEFCEACAKPLVVFLSGFLKVNNKKNK